MVSAASYTPRGSPDDDQGVALPSDIQGPTPARLVGRADLLATVESQLAAGGTVVLNGPSGIGKTSVMDVAGTLAAARGERVLRIHAAETERWISFAGLADLLGQVPVDHLAELPDPQRAAVNAVLLRGRAGGGGSRARLARRLAWQGLLQRGAAAGPVLFLIDDAQWLDAGSADVIAYASRRVDGTRVRAVITQRWPDRPDGRKVETAPTGPTARLRMAPGADRIAGILELGPAPVIELTVPPLAADDLVELLDRYGLPARAASRVHADSGGNPYLALALCGAFGGQAVPGRGPVPLPLRVRSLLGDRIGVLPAEVRETLLVAALCTRPTIPLLVRAGRNEAEREIRMAVTVGLVVTDGTAVRFTPPAVATVLAESASAAHRLAVHAALAQAAPDSVERARHRALATADADAGVARSLVTAAESARRLGARGLAGELYLLAADRTPPELAIERLDWLVAAAEAAAAAGRSEIVSRAAEAVLAADAPPAHRVRVRLAEIDLSGQAMAGMEEAFAFAVADADDDPALMSLLRLRLAWQAMIDGNPQRAEAEADQAIATAQVVGDTSCEAMALAVKAQVARVLGRPDYLGTLEQALALPQPALDGRLHLTPRYLAARFAIFDDRLADARSELYRMLALVERGGGEELAEVLRSLSEVFARTGRCREALDYAERAVRVAQESGLSPGPAWYNAAVAELAGGSVARAAGYAERGVRASEEERDSIFLCRNLHALAQVRLRTGDARGGVQLLRRIRDVEATQGVTEPSVVRWHSDLASGLVAIGELAEAADTIAGARAGVAGRSHMVGVLTRLDRAEALLRSARGDAEGAASLLVAAAERFDLLGQPIERGHTLLVLGQVERRRRRYAAARAAVGHALAVFAEVAAAPWVEQANRTLARVDGASQELAAGNRRRADPGLVPVLTATEARIAALVGEGASNREIAIRLYLSVKTVEATLTRIYRKVGVRSRTQLSSRLATRPGT